MVWNPFDRRSNDQRMLDDALVGLTKPDWIGNPSAPTGRFAAEALSTWRSGGSKPDAPSASNWARNRVGRRNVEPLLIKSDVDAVQALRRTECGSAAYAAAVLASAVHSLDVWSAHAVAHHLVRIDLSAEVRSIAGSAGLLQASFDRLGNRPSGHLGDDAQVQAIYSERAAMLAERRRGLCDRVTAFRAYFDGLLAVQREWEKMRWIERHGASDAADFEAHASDEMGAARLAAVSEVVVAAAERLSSLEHPPANS